MKLFETLKLSFFALRANKARSFLTSLGIIIGIAAVIVIISVGAGFQSLVVNQLTSMGTNLIGILPGSSSEDGPPASVMGIVVTTLKYKDALAISREVENVAVVSSYNSGIAQISYRHFSTDSNFYGVMANYPKVESAKIIKGRFFNKQEERQNARLAILGHQVWQELFAGRDPVGEQIKINKEYFQVIGVLKQRGTAGFQNQDDLVLIPVSTAQNIMLGVDYVNFIRVKVNHSENLDRAVQEIRLLLRDRHNIPPDGEDDFSVRNTKDAIKILKTITDAIRFFLAAIAAISLIVGGVGIMNIMLASVRNRVREIGLRKAVGARQNDILIQFLLESVIITLFGGLIGVILGSLISAFVAFLAEYLGYQWELVISLKSIVAGGGVALLVGLIFGIYPARKAARLDPIEALRYE